MNIYYYGIIETVDEEEEIVLDERINFGNGNYQIKAPSLDTYDGNDNEEDY